MAGLGSVSSSNCLINAAAAFFLFFSFASPRTCACVRVCVCLTINRQSGTSTESKREDANRQKQQLQSNYNGYEKKKSGGMTKKEEKKKRKELLQLRRKIVYRQTSRDLCAPEQHCDGYDWGPAGRPPLDFFWNSPLRKPYGRISPVFAASSQFPDALLQARPASHV